MDCFMCSSANGSLQKLQTDIDIEILEQIVFVLPDLAFPDTKAAVYACATCLQEMATFYEIKRTSLGNNCRLNLYQDILKGDSEEKFKVLKIVNYSNELSVKIEQNTELEIDLYCKDPLSLEDEDQFAETYSNLSYGEVSKKQSLTEDKPFKCNNCDETFTCRSLLESHTHFHTGERPYTCATCQKTFTTSSNLSSHKLIHTSEKPYDCDICHKTYSHKNSLIFHKRSHSNPRPYRCAICSKRFTRSFSLKAHTHSHMGEKPHQCAVCPYKCIRADALKRHIRTHSGEKPYSCHLCPKSFTQLNNLKQHKRISHSNECQSLLNTQNNQFTSF